MNKFICVGTSVTDGNKNGVVISIDTRTKVAVMCGYSRVWTDNIRNLEVVSYREVQ